MEIKKRQNFFFSLFALPEFTYYYELLNLMFPNEILYYFNSDEGMRKNQNNVAAELNKNSRSKNEKIDIK